MGMICSQSDGPGLPSLSEQSSGAARRGEAVSARGRGASTPRPFLPHTPSFPGSSRRPSAALRVRAPLSGLAAYGGYSPRLPDAGTRCREVGETGAPLPSLRSGRLRRPAREERDSSRRRTSPRRAGESRNAIRCPSGSRAVFCVRPLWWTARCPRRGRRRGSTSSIDGRRELTGVLLRSGGSSASLAIRCSSLLPTRGLKSSPYFRAGRSLPHTQADAAPLPPDSPQATRQPAGSLVTIRASVSFGGRTSRPRRSPTPKKPRG